MANKDIRFECAFCNTCTPLIDQELIDRGDYYDRKIKCGICKNITIKTYKKVEKIFTGKK